MMKGLVTIDHRKLQLTVFESGIGDGDGSWNIKKETGSMGRTIVNLHTQQEGRGKKSANLV